VPTGVNRKTSKTHHAANISTRTPAGFLIKDLIIPECGNSCNDDENKK
jgi:hypothetical protein